MIYMSQALRLFEGFSALDRLTSRVRFAGVIGGEGPAPRGSDRRRNRKLHRRARAVNGRDERGLVIVTTALLLARLDWLLPLSAIAATTVRRANRMSRFESDCHRIRVRRENCRDCREPTFSPNGALWNTDSGSASVRLDVEGPDDAAPLLGFFGDVPSK